MLRTTVITEGGDQIGVFALEIVKNTICVAYQSTLHALIHTLKELVCSGERDTLFTRLSKLLKAVILSSSNSLLSEIFCGWKKKIS